MTCLLVQTTCGSADEARAIARALVAERLAACVQIGAVGSVYRWQGAVEEADEQRLDIKTTAALYPDVERRVRALHSYDLPEIVAVPLTGSADYLAWVAAQVG